MPIESTYARQWLVQATRDAGLGSSIAFIEGTMRRLDKGAEEYGPDSYKLRGLGRVLAEGGEEGLDMAGWAILGSDLIVPGGAAHDDRAEAARAHLLAASSAGVTGWDHFRIAAELLKP